MTEPVLIKIGYVAAAVIAYGLLRWRLMRVTHEFRIRVGRDADRWACESRVKPRMRATLAGLADMAYRPATPWLLLLGLVVAMVLPFRARRDMEISDDAEVAAEVLRLKVNLVFALITTSPLACVLAVAVLTFGLLARRSVGGFRDRISAAGDRVFPNADARYSHSI